jgi:glycosyltransferase involved in cell wall biosynthesis
MKNILVFHTFKNSLKTWQSNGTLLRELKYYEYLTNHHNFKITFFSYGTKEDSSILAKVSKNMKVITLFEKPKIRNSFIIFIYSIYFLYQKRNLFKNFDYFKSNQNYGSWLPAICKFFFHKKFISRCGYDLFHFALTEKKIFKILLSYLICFFSYQSANIIFVPTLFYKKFITKYFFIRKKKIHVLPNFVDTSIFDYKKNIQRFRDRILFIGRLEKQKNIFSTLLAFKNTNYCIDMLGKGNLKASIIDFSFKNNIKINFIDDFIESQKLPNLINKYEFLILFSYYEGNPKILLEAMSCGVCPIVSNVTGINNIITNKKNGLIFELNEIEKIKEILFKINNDEIKEIQQNARKYILNSHDIFLIMNKEANFLK